MTTRKRLVLVGTCLVLFAGLLAAVFFALNRAVPVATEYTAGTLTLTSRSDSAWTARVAAGDTNPGECVRARCASVRVARFGWLWDDGPSGEEGHDDGGTA